MPDVEGLGDVDGRKVDAHRFSAPEVGSAVIFAGRQHRFQHVLRALCLIVKEIKIGALHFGPLHEIRPGRLVLQLGSDGLRRLAQAFGQLEANHRQVAHIPLGRRFQQLRDVLRAQAERVLYAIYDLRGKIHLSQSFPSACPFPGQGYCGDRKSCARPLLGRIVLHFTTVSIPRQTGR